MAAVDTDHRDSIATHLPPLPRRRRLVDGAVRWGVAVGGAGVVAAIALIFVYLLWVVAPLTVPGSAESEPVPSPIDAQTRMLGVNESDEFALTVQADGTVRFNDVRSGQAVPGHPLGIPVDAALPVYESPELVAIRSGEELYFADVDYVVDFASGARKLHPVVREAFEFEPLTIGASAALDVWRNQEQMAIASVDGKGNLTITRFRDVDPDYMLEFGRHTRLALGGKPDVIYFGPRGQWLYVIADGVLESYDIGPGRAPRLASRTVLGKPGERLVIAPLAGRHSFLVADETGLIRQFSQLRDERGYHFEVLRTFDAGAEVTRLLPEQRRKGFLAITSDRLIAYHTTAERRIFEVPLGGVRPDMAALSPRADLLLVADASGSARLFDIHNEHPEVSWSALWSKVWYEGYPKPVFSWQSSSADNDFEPKFSLTPLLFGTLKAAFYAMLFAAPMAIMGAVYSGYFMHPAMRSVVKPGIEIMAALPTVVLGFLAGLWLAPLIETHLAAVLSTFLVVPAGVLLFAYLYAWLPAPVRRAGAGWYGAICIPVLAILVWIAYSNGARLELALFDGDLKGWLLHEAGLNYDQRNALVVGIAMGLAVIPTIFSIAEDAIYAVPTHLKQGSLALGATEWQTLVRVVLLTASPGIFSALMIGLGRAVGETMIVLMATGNTPVMDMNIFEGMRTFAANIAVELPEAEVASTHYRILFLAALVLFGMTFVVNTVAELVRQNLRTRYGSL